MSLFLGRWVILFGVAWFHKQTRIEYLLSERDVFIIFLRRFFITPVCFAVVGFQDVLDSFVSVYQSCWVIEI